MLERITFFTEIETLQNVRGVILENLITINSKKVFTVGEARKLLPLIYRITECSQTEVKKMVNKLEAIKETSTTQGEKIEKEINEEINRWQEKVQKLGAVAKGLWLVDFDNGQGFFCWKFPENDIRYWHGYQDGFSGRIEIQ